AQRERQRWEKVSDPQRKFDKVSKRYPHPCQQPRKDEGYSDAYERADVQEKRVTNCIQRARASERVPPTLEAETVVLIGRRAVETIGDDKEDGSKRKNRNNRHQSEAQPK